jgi:hypothetical protein
MIGTESGREQRPGCTCGTGTGEQGPNRPPMCVGGEHVPDTVGVMGGGGIVEGLAAEKPRTPPREIREYVEGALPAA